MKLGGITNMKKFIQIVLTLMMMTTIIACQKEAAPTNFWPATVKAIENKIGKDTNYNEDQWEIGIADKVKAKDEDRDLAIRRYYKDQTISRKVVMAFQTEQDAKRVDYIYERSETKDENEYKDIITLKSTDAAYTSYSIHYAKQEFRNGNYFDGSEAEGTLKVNEDQSITYDNLPYLGESMEYLRTLLSDLKDAFQLNYQDYQDFVNVPEIAKNTEFPNIDEIPDENAKTVNYYAEPSINAKGYSTITFLEVGVDLNATFGRFSIEQDTFIENFTVALEKRSIENCYNIMQNDPDVPYAVYLQDDTAYLYKQALSDQEIEDNVVKEGGNKANLILKTTNKSYDEMRIKR